jgi:DNA repair protein RadD
LTWLQTLPRRSRYYQKVGRGFRVVYADGFDLNERAGRLAAIAAGPKPDCLYVDFAGNALEHGPVDAIRVQQPRKKGEAAKVVTGKAKECPKCSAIIPMQTRTCECGHQFGSTEPGHLDRPVDAPVLSTDRPRVVTRHVVGSVGYARHSKPGKPPSLRVNYQCGMRRFSEWICIEHAGMARAKALQWWTARADGTPPRSVEEALPLAWQLPTPVSIEVDETEKYSRVTNYEFAERSGEGALDPGDGTDAGALASVAGTDAVHAMRGVPDWLLRAVDNKRAA